MGADRSLPVCQADDLRELREVRKTVRYEDDGRAAFLGPGLKIAECFILSSSIERGEGVIEDADGTPVAERAGKTQALPLASGEPASAFAGKGLLPFGQSLDLICKARFLKCQSGIRTAYEADIVFDRGIEELRVMSQNGEDALSLRCDRALMRELSCYAASKAALVRGDRTADADNLARRHSK